MVLSSSAIERKGEPHALFVHARGKESPQPRDPLRLSPHQVAESRSSARNDLQQCFGYQVRSWTSLFRRANGFERSLSPQVILANPLCPDFSIVHHRRLEKAGLCEGHQIVEGLELVA